MFGWEQEEVGYKSLADQKNATRIDVSGGVSNSTPWDSFRTNNDEFGYPQAGMVIGEDPMPLTYGEGVAPVITVTYINSKAEFEAAETGCLKDYMASASHITADDWVDGSMYWAVANVDVNGGALAVNVNGSTYGVVVKNGGTTPIDNRFPVSKEKTYLIVDKGEVFVNDEVVTDVTKIGFTYLAD